RLTELKTCSGPTRSSSSTGGTATTTIRRLAPAERARREDGVGMPGTIPPPSGLCKANRSGGGIRRVCVGKRRTGLRYDRLWSFARRDMNLRRLGIMGAALATLAPHLSVPIDADAEKGPSARIAVLRPHDGDTVDFEAGYIRHLDWHRQARDTWVWYGWNVTYGDRQRWFDYASFGHSAASLDNPVPPAEDERDNVLNVTPHAQFVGNALYGCLPGLRGAAGEPQPTTRLELTTVDLQPGAEKRFEAALAAVRGSLQGETLWYRMVAGGAAPRYVRLRPRPSLTAVLEGRGEQA